eukprot:Opistho-2@68881
MQMASAPIGLPSSQAMDLPGLLSQTPGGSIYGTTPGGTKIYYDRNTLLKMRDSPLAKAVPVRMPSIPGVTLVGDNGDGVVDNKDQYDGASDGDDTPQFDME